VNSSSIPKTAKALGLAALVSYVAFAALAEWLDRQRKHAIL
jgi:hypothetical protein